MVNGKNDDAVGLNQKMNHERKATKYNRPPHFPSDFGEGFRTSDDTLKGLPHYGTKFPPQAFSLAFVPCDRTLKLLFSNATKNQAAFHQEYFTSSLALTSSHDTTSPGFSRCSCRRRSMNSASPGVNSLDSTMLSHRLRHNSICSASGRARASLRTNSELINFTVHSPLNLASA